MNNDELTFRDLVRASFYINKERSTDIEPVIKPFNMRDTRTALNWCKDTIIFVWQSATFRNLWCKNQGEFPSINLSKKNPTTIKNKNCFVALWVALRLHYPLRHMNHINGKIIQKYDIDESLVAHNYRTTNATTDNRFPTPIQWAGLDSGRKFSYVDETMELAKYRKKVCEVAEGYIDDLVKGIDAKGFLMEIDYTGLNKELAGKIDKCIDKFDSDFVKNVIKEGLYPQIEFQAVDEQVEKIKKKIEAEQQLGVYDTFGKLLKINTD